LRSDRSHTVHQPKTENRKQRTDNRTDNLLLRVAFGPTLELLLVLVGRIRRVFDLGVFAGERGAAAVGLEELGGRLVTADFHGAQLGPLPDCGRLGQPGEGGGGEQKMPTVQVGRAHERDVHAEVPVVRGAVEAQIDAKGHRRPGGILLAAVEAYLEGGRESASA
jgi:hypothetical protein